MFFLAFRVVLCSTTQNGNDVATPSKISMTAIEYQAAICSVLLPVIENEKSFDLVKDDVAMLFEKFKKELFCFLTSCDKHSNNESADKHEELASIKTFRAWVDDCKKEVVKKSREDNYSYDKIVRYVIVFLSCYTEQGFNVYFINMQKQNKPDAEYTYLSYSEDQNGGCDYKITKIESDTAPTFIALPEQKNTIIIELDRVSRDAAIFPNFGDEANRSTYIFNCNFICDAIYKLLDALTPYFHKRIDLSEVVNIIHEENEKNVREITSITNKALQNKNLQKLQNFTTNRHNVYFEHPHSVKYKFMILICVDYLLLNSESAKYVKNIIVTSFLFYETLPCKIFYNFDNCSAKDLVESLSSLNYLYPETIHQSFRYERGEYSATNALGNRLAKKCKEKGDLGSKSLVLIVLNAAYQQRLF